MMMTKQLHHLPLLLLVIGVTDAFITPSRITTFDVNVNVNANANVNRNIVDKHGNGHTHGHSHKHLAPPLSMASKNKGGKSTNKGFGKQKDMTKKTSSNDSTNTNTNTNTNENANTTTSASTLGSTTKTNAGADALSRLRRQQAEQKDEELRAIRDIKSMDEYISNEPDAAVIPEQVAQRMGQRMLPFVGIPLFGVMGTFIVFWYLATYRNLEFQPALVAFSTIGVLGVSLLGITYSVMSASWDPEVKGSVVGFDEFKTNLGNIQDGLKRTRENAILRDKMDGLPEAEIQRAIRDLDKRDQRAKKKNRSIEEKIQQELE